MSTMSRRPAAARRRGPPPPRCGRSRPWRSRSAPRAPSRRPTCPCCSSGSPTGPGLIGAVMLVNAAAGFVVPLATGLWSDRRGTRGPFILGGARRRRRRARRGRARHRQLLPRPRARRRDRLHRPQRRQHRAPRAGRRALRRRPARRRDGAQEGAMLAGALAGTLAGGALIDGSAAALFALWAIALPLLALPTLAWQRAAAPSRPPRRERREGSPCGCWPRCCAATARATCWSRRCSGSRRTPRSRRSWCSTPRTCSGCAAAAAGACWPASALLTGAGMLAGARMPADRLRATLCRRRAARRRPARRHGGVEPRQGAVPFAAAALGAGLVSAVGFPYFTRFVPDGQAGRYAGAFFSARAIASTAALPTAGLLIAATGSYRALLGMGALGLAALVPLARAERRRERAQCAAARPADPAAGRRDAGLPLRPRRQRRGRDAAPRRRPRARRRRRAAADRRVLDDAARDPRVRVVRLGGNHGKGTAVAAGVEAALERDPDAVIVLDSDGQHPPELIPAFVRGGRARRRRDRRPPRARRRCRASRRVANARVELGAEPRRPPAPARHAERHAAVPRRRAARRAAAGRPLRGRDAAPQGAHPQRPRGRVGRRCRRSTAASRARSAPSPTRCAWRARSSRRPQPRPASPRPAAAAIARRRARVGAADRPRHAARVGRRCRAAAAGGRSTSGCSSRSTASATGRSGSTRRSTRTAATTCCWPRRPRSPCSPRRAASGTPAARCSRWRSPACSPTSCSRSSSSASTGRGPRRRSAPRSQRSHGRHWSHIPSFPSGHLIVTTALVVAAVAMAPVLRVPAARLPRGDRGHARSRSARTSRSTSSSARSSAGRSASSRPARGARCCRRRRAGLLEPARAVAPAPATPDARGRRASSAPDREPERRAGEHVEPEVNAEVDAREGRSRAATPSTSQRRRGASTAIAAATAKAVIAWPDGNDGDAGSATSASRPTRSGGRLRSTRSLISAFSPEASEEAQRRGERDQREHAAVARGRRTSPAATRSGPLTHQADTSVRIAVAGAQRSADVARIASWSRSTSSCRA